MVKTVKYTIFICLSLITFIAFSQTANYVPYSKFGLGDLTGPILPQNKSMGGIGMGIRKMGTYSVVNPMNPASYSSIELTTFDIGTTSGLRSIEGVAVRVNTDFNTDLSHIMFGLPINKKSAFSFGLFPYSKVQYQYSNSSTTVTTNISRQVDYVYVGDGGLSKAYVGYGFLLNPKLSLGANLSCLFGNLRYSQSIEFPQGGSSSLNSREQLSNRINGFSIDYGLQYILKNILSKSRITVGYVGTLTEKLNATSITENTNYYKNFVSGEEIIPSDPQYSSKEGKPITLLIPMKHTIGFLVENVNRFLWGIDLSYSPWIDFRQGSDNPGFNDIYTLAVGGQITPHAGAISNYFKLIDYRAGFKYDRTYIRVNNHGVNEYSLSFGLGLPLPANRLAIYKINVSTAFGRRGTLANGLALENYFNFSLGFIMNDKWFIKPKFD